MGISRTFWPYDEVTVSRDTQFPARFTVKAPWLEFYIDISPVNLERADKIVTKWTAGKLEAADLPDLNWFFTALADHPVAYIVPRPHNEGTDHHALTQSELKGEGPRELLMALAAASSGRSEFQNIANSYLPQAWSWDIDAALEFSRTPQGFDPESLFSVARRFHLLNDLEWNQTADLLAFVNILKTDAEKFRKASALIVRQNHYVTAQCDLVLRSSLPLAQTAEASILEFIKAESGHDVILARALRSLGAEPKDVPTVDSVVVLMEVFRLVAGRNLLAFAMVVDIFERTSYHDEDPMASLLNAGGQEKAGRDIDIHRQINDVGEHENVALEFLNNMAPVDEAYAREALKLAELATLVIHQLSKETLARIKASA